MDVAENHNVKISVTLFHKDFRGLAETDKVLYGFSTFHDQVFDIEEQSDTTNYEINIILLSSKTLNFLLSLSVILENEISRDNYQRKRFSSRNFTFVELFEDRSINYPYFMSRKILLLSKSRCSY